MASPVFRPSRLLSVPLLLCSWLALAVPSVLAQSQPYLSGPDSNGFYRPDESLRLRIADPLLPDVAGVLSLELDGMDVTALAQRQGTDLTYAPVQPLAPGERELRLVFYGNQGQVWELGHWIFEVRHSERFRELEARGQVDLAVSQRIAERDHGRGEDFRAQGGGYLESSVSGDNWRLDSNLDVMAVSDTDYAIAGQPVDLARFNLRGEYDRYRFALGDQQLAPASLIQDGFERRGIATGAQLPFWGGSVSLYRASSQQQVGVDSGLGGDDADNRLSGGRLELWPVRGERAKLSVAAERLSGRVGEPDYASFDPNAESVVHAGDAWSVTMDGLFFERQLRVRYEQAASEYDFDGADGDFDPERDDAWAALVVLDPAPASDFHWRLGLESKKMGTWYRSLANRYAPADKRMQRVFFNVTKDKWRADGGYAVEQNNLTDDADYATSETRQWHFNAGYYDYEAAAGPVLTLLGQPSYTLSAGGTTLKDDYTPEGFLVNDLQTRRYGLTAAFRKDQLQWSAGYHYDTLDDATGWQPRARTQTTQLDAGWYPSVPNSLFASWQHQYTRYPEQGASTDRDIYSLNGQVELVPKRLQAGLNIGLNQTRARDDPFFAQWDETTYISAHLNWRLRESNTHFAGLDLILSFTRNDYRSQLSMMDAVGGYQAFIELRSNVPVAYPGGRL